FSKTHGSNGAWIRSGWNIDDLYVGSPPNYKLTLTPANQSGAAALGNYATYNLNVQNQGALNDSYNIALAGNTWISQALLNGSPITNTGNINSGTSLSLQIQVNIPSGASNGQMDNLAVTLTSVGDPTVYKTANISTVAIGNCTIPMNENFDSGILNPGNFPQTTDNSLDPNGLVNDLASNEPSGMYALHLNAYPQLGDTVTSCIFDLSGQTAIDFYYSYEKGAGQSSPGQGEFLIVEYLNSTQNWIQLNSHEGDWNTQFDFVPVELQLPQDAFHSNFRFRIFNTSPGGGWPGSSNWAVDNIFLGLPPNYKVSLSPKTIAGSSTIGSTLTYTITVNNQGVLNDNYNISFTGNTWATQTLVNGIPATNTGNINSGTSATFNIEVTIPQTATSGQSDNLVVTVTSVNDATVSKTVSGSTTAIGTSPLPLADNFDTGILNVNNWPQSTDNSLDPDGIINSYAPNPPSGIYSLHLNSYPQLGDTVTSSIVNLSGQSVITLNYYFLVGGGSGTPGPGNFLKAEYLNSSQNWVPLNIHDGTWVWPPPTDFTEVNSLLPQDALHSNFRVRFLSIGQWSCQGCNSWAVDDVFLGVPPPYKFSFTPTFANGNGYPGDTVTYPYVIKNKGLNADSYNLAVSGNTYPTAFWANGNPITVTGTIVPGDSLVLSVEVAIPQTATLGFVDAVNITVTSVGDPTISKNSAINTLTGDTMPPEAPSSLIGTLNGTQVDLVWQNPLYNIDGTPLTDLAKIKIYRQDNASPFPFFSLIDSVAAPNQNYSDLAPFVNTSYYLTAVDFSGNESWQSNVTNVFNIAGLGTVVWQDTLETTTNWVFASSDPTVIWNVDATPSNALGTSVPYAGTACLNYNNGTNFDTYGSANNGTATLNQNLNLSGLADPTLFFWSLSDTEWGNYYDQKWVEISNDNFVTTIATYQIVPQQQGVWEPVTVTLDTAWQSVQLRFRFDTIDGAGNSGAGWFIDNLGLYSSVDILGPDFSGLGMPKVIDNFSTYEKVKVTVTDPSGVDFVQLNYRIGETGNFTSVTMNLSQVVSVYLDSIPPPANVTKTKVYCYFMARDLSDSSNISYFPKNYLADPLNNLFSYEVRLVPPGTLDDEPDYGEINLSWGQPGENGIELKYDDGSSEFQSTLPNSPPGLNNPSVATFASRFDIATQTQINGNAQLNSIKIFIPNGAVPNAGYKLRVFEDNQGQPGNLIWESPDQQQTAPFGQFVNFELVDPLTNLGLPVGSGIFYVGVEQTSSTLISLGGDTSFNPPYVFNSNTHFLQGQGTGWAAIESLAPIYGQIIPMIRCFVEPVPIAPAPQLSVNKQKTVGKQEFRFKKGNSTSGKGSVNVTLTYPIVAYKLYKKNGASQNALEVVTTGSVIYTGTNQTYTDLQVIYPNQYSYAVTVVYNVNGTNVESEPGNLVVSTPLFNDDNEPQNLIPTVFSIEQNYPNPFNPVTNIKFGIPEKTFTRLVVYNILGQLVKTIVSKELTPSYYTFRWDGTDNNGNQVSSGVYFAKIEAGKFVKTKKMTFLK
ncbi:T9SS type A sorting domain-containing protein, partial [bacterium]|nr:T9SS type A sorting domain-containing protein [bacterium]